VSIWWQTSLGRLRALGFIEGVSFVLLLAIAMPLKYFAGEPGAVRVVGMAHGVLFLLYLLAVVQAAVEYEWSWRRVGWLVLVCDCGPQQDLRRLPGLPVGRLAAAPLAELAQRDAIGVVALRLIRLVIAPLAVLAGEGYCDSDISASHSLS
jgi:integral membrane protein